MSQWCHQSYSLLLLDVALNLHVNIAITKSLHHRFPENTSSSETNVWRLSYFCESRSSLVSSPWCQSSCFQPDKLWRRRSSHGPPLWTPAQPHDAQLTWTSGQSDPRGKAKTRSIWRDSRSDRPRARSNHGCSSHVARWTLSRCLYLLREMDAMVQWSKINTFRIDSQNSKCFPSMSKPSKD